MRPKTTLIILLAIALTIVALQAAGMLNLLPIASKRKLVMVVAVLAFVLGYVAGRPARHQSVREYIREQEENNPDTLSEEDRDYIS